MLAIAAAGPAAGFLLAGISYSMTSGPRWSGNTMWLLTVINLVLSIFNLLPTVPLDGGQILKSFLSLAVPNRGDKIAHAISLIVAVAAVWWAMTHGHEITALMFLGFVSINYGVLRSGSRSQVRPA